MNFIAALVVYLVIGAILGAGMVLALSGNWWYVPLVIGVLAYLVVFAKIGCLPPSDSH